MNAFARKCITLTTLTLLLTAASQAQDLGVPGATFVTTLEGVSEHQLGNGLRVLLFPDDSKQSFTMNVTYLVGSKHESYGETGMAHLLEHLMFKGTPTRPKLVDEFTARGAGAGGDANATTGSDRTNYFETLASTPENLRWAIEMEADRMVNSTLAPADLVTERTVVRNELERGENDPIRTLVQQTEAAAYTWHNYGKSTIGTRSDLESVPRENIERFYKTYYQPDNAYVILSGKFDAREALELITKTFGQIPRPNRTLPPQYTVEPPQDGERNITVERIGEIRVYLSAYHIPAATHPDLAALDLLTSIISDEPAGLLYKSLVESKQALQTGAWVSANQDPGLLYSYVITSKDGNLDQARDTLVAAVENYAKAAPSAEELQRIKTRYETFYDSLLADAQAVGNQLSESAAMGDWKLFFWYRDQLQKVTPQDIQRAAATYLKAINRTSGTFKPLEARPERVVVPATPSAQQVLQGYTGRAAVQAGEVLSSDPLEIEKRVVRGELSPDQKYAVLTKRTRGDKVYVSIALNWGTAENLKGRTLAGNFVPNLLLRGSQQYTRQQIQDRLDSLKTLVSVSGGATGMTLTLESDRTRYQEALAFLSEVLRTPTFPEQDFAELKSQLIAGLQDSKANPETQISDFLGKQLMPPGTQPGDLYYAQNTDEQIASVQQLTIEDLRQFYKDFYGANHLDAALVGEVPAEDFRAQLQKFTTGWTSPAAYADLKAPFVQSSSVNQSFNTPDKPNAVFVARSTFQLNRRHPDYPALTVANYIFGGGLLNSRLATRLRQQEGLSYSAGSGVTVPLDSDNARFTVQAMFNPANLQAAEKAFFEELNRALTEGFTAAEVETAKSSFLQSEAVALTDDASLLGILMSHLANDRSFKNTAETYAAIAALTPEQVNAAFRKYIVPANLIFVKAGDFQP